jgi:PIN domain nuclease of toxin-antitoxin system
MSRGLLLDTCAMIWMAHDDPIEPEARMELVRTRRSGGVIAVSAMSAWEVGMLISKGRLPTTKSASSWFQTFVNSGQTIVEEASAEILIASSFLPRPIHNDPTDRILIATAREHDLTIVTRDRAILSYGAAGHVKVLAC